MSQKIYRVACYPQPRLYPVKLNVVSTLAPISSDGVPLLQVSSVHPPMFVYDAGQRAWHPIPQPFSMLKKS